MPCMSGDDKCLTRQILKRGYATVLQRWARVWSTFPGTPKTFFRQRLRWSRNTWRSGLKALALERWGWRHPSLAFTMTKAVGSFTLLASPMFMALAVVRREWSFVVVLASWWWLSRWSMPSDRSILLLAVPLARRNLECLLWLLS